MIHKDYNIHTEWAEAERKRRLIAMDKDRERRGMFATAPWWFCETCGGSFHGPEFMYCPCLFDWKQKSEDTKLHEVSEQDLIEMEKSLSESDIELSDRFIEYLKSNNKCSEDEMSIFLYAFDFIMESIYGITKENERELDNTFVLESMDNSEALAYDIMPYIIHKVKEAPWKLKTVWDW